jgi:hypothetical protein
LDPSDGPVFLNIQEMIEMKTPARILLLFIHMFSFLNFLACKSGIQQNVYENPDASHKILITGSTSEFKEVVVAGIVERYRDACHIEILSSSRVKRANFGNYNAIIIMDECQAWMAFNIRTMELIRKIKDKDRIILFITAGDPDWQFSTQGIDAITSASEKGKEEQVIEKISARIDDLIK